MTLFGQMLGLAGVDMNTGTPRFTFGFLNLYDGVELVALALGLFGIAEFLKSVNRIQPLHLGATTARRCASATCCRSRAELRTAAMPMLRGTLIGSLCAMVPGTGPTIASFVAYATEKKISKTPERFGTGMIAGVASPEASTHSSIQGDFIPTMSMGIPGDSGMALLLGALMIQGITPGPLLIAEHPDIFWGLIASFWVGNIILVILNVPLIGIWVRMLAIPYRLLYPSALFRVHRRLQRQEQPVRNRRNHRIRRRRLLPDPAALSRRADPARLHPRPAHGREFRATRWRSRTDIYPSSSLARSAPFFFASAWQWYWRNCSPACAAASSGCCR